MAHGKEEVKAHFEKPNTSSGCIKPSPLFVDFLSLFIVQSITSLFFLFFYFPLITVDIALFDLICFEMCGFHLSPLSIKLSDLFICFCLLIYLLIIYCFVIHFYLDYS